MYKGSQKKAIGGAGTEYDLLFKSEGHFLCVLCPPVEDVLVLVLLCVCVCVRACGCVSARVPFVVSLCASAAVERVPGQEWVYIHAFVCMCECMNV